MSLSYGCRTDRATINIYSYFDPYVLVHVTCALADMIPLQPCNSGTSVHFKLEIVSELGETVTHKNEYNIHPSHHGPRLLGERFAIAEAAAARATAAACCFSYV